MVGIYILKLITIYKKKHFMAFHEENDFEDFKHLIKKNSTKKDIIKKFDKDGLIERVDYFNKKVIDQKTGKQLLKEQNFEE